MANHPVHDKFEDMVRHINAVKLRPVINKVGKMVIKVSKN